MQTHLDNGRKDMLQKKTVALMAAAVLSLTSLTACASTPPSGELTPEERSVRSSGDPDKGHTFTQILPDGREVLCVWVKDGYGGGLSCDWVGLHKQDQPTSTPEPSPSPTF